MKPATYILDEIREILDDPWFIAAGNAWDLADRLERALRVAIKDLNLFDQWDPASVAKRSIDKITAILGGTDE